MVDMQRIEEVYERLGILNNSNKLIRVHYEINWTSTIPYLQTLLREPLGVVV